MRKIKIEIKWAILFTLMIMCWMYLEKWVGLHSTHIDQHLYYTNLFTIPAVVLMVLALKDKKKNFYASQMTYVQGLVSGVKLSIIIALLSPLTQWIISSLITPEYFPNVIAHSVASGYYESEEAARAYFNLTNYMVQSTFFALIMGGVTTAIAMIFIRSKNKEN